MTITNIAIGFCWLILIIFWTIQRKWSKPSNQVASTSIRLWYTGSLVIGFLLIWESGIRGNVFPLDILLFTSSLVTNIIAVLFAVLGVALAIWARVVIGTNWSSSVQIKKDHALVTAAPYAYIRHPIYTAVLMMVIADVLTQGTVGAILGFMVILLSFWIKLRQEEKFMLQQFPDQYPAFMKRTKRLVPLLF
jgi:protein-S-isoprenylcysteine O-methyltransferase Ste14